MSNCNLDNMPDDQINKNIKRRPAQDWDKIEHDNKNKKRKTK